jgi:hypothetical protein
MPEASRSLRSTVIPSLFLHPRLFAARSCSVTTTCQMSSLGGTWCQFSPHLYDNQTQDSSLIISPGTTGSLERRWEDRPRIISSASCHDVAFIFDHQGTPMTIPPAASKCNFEKPHPRCNRLGPGTRSSAASRLYMVAPVNHTLVWKR